MIPYSEIVRVFGGTQEAVAETLGVTQQAVSRWKKRGGPPRHWEKMLDHRAKSMGCKLRRAVRAMETAAGE